MAAVKTMFITTAAWTAAGSHLSVSEPSLSGAKQMLWALVPQLWPFSRRGCLVTAYSWDKQCAGVLLGALHTLHCLIASLKSATEITLCPANRVAKTTPVSWRFSSIQRLLILSFVLNSLGLPLPQTTLSFLQKLHRRTQGWVCHSSVAHALHFGWSTR